MLVLNFFQRFCIDVATTENCGTQLCRDFQLFVNGGNLSGQDLLVACRNRCRLSSVYFLYQSSGDGKSVVANGVLYPPITFMRGIGNNSLAVLEANYVGLRAEAPGCKTKECQFESQTKKL